jgi:hypothetical protein
VSRGRLEAFSDGVIAILITIMVLDLRTPRGTTWDALREDLPVLLAYVLSFVNLGIYWNNSSVTCPMASLRRCLPVTRGMTKACAEASAGWGRTGRAPGCHRTIACREPGCTSVYYEPPHDRRSA